MTDSQNQDRNYLLSEQYKDASNLSARVDLHRQFSTNPYGWFRWLFEQFDVPANARILEVGAGPGLFWAGNADRIPAGWQITLSDFSPGMVEAQQRNLKESHHPFTHQLIDVQSIPFEDNTFDMVGAHHMLYHVPDLPKALAEIRRVLKPGGKLYAATNGPNHLREMHELVQGYDPRGIGYESTQIPFRLDNGAALLGPFFSQIEIRTYPDNLKVTQVQPLVGYVLSSIRLNTDHRAMQNPADFAEYVQQRMQQTGSITITKETGVLIATRPSTTP